MSNNKNIIPVTEETIEVFKNAVPEIIEKTVRAALDKTDLMGRTEEQVREKYREGFKMVAQILESIMVVGEPELLEDQLKWADKRLPHEGIMPEQILKNFKEFRGAVNEVLRKEYAAEILPYIDYLISRQEEIVT